MSYKYKLKRSTWIKKWDYDSNDLCERFKESIKDLEDTIYYKKKDKNENIKLFEIDFEYLCKQLENFDDAEYRSNFESEVRCLINKYKCEK